MSPLASPVGWLELAIAIALAGSLAVNLCRDPVRAWGWGVAFTGAVFGCCFCACAIFYGQATPDGEFPPGFCAAVLGGPLLVVDGLNAPLIPVLGLIHFLTAFATGRTKMRRFSLAWSLAGAAIRLGVFGCMPSWLMVALLIACVIPPHMELRNRGRSTRIYVLHMGLFAVLLVLGWSAVDLSASYQEQSAWASVPLLLAILIRCGIVPVHCWLMDWFENASFGNALLFVTPLIGVYAAVRLVLPVAPDWALQSLSVISLITGVYGAGMALVQEHVRRFFAYLFLSHASLILVGLEMHTPISLTGALALWMSVSLSLAGLGLTLRALEARFGALRLSGFHGLYNHTPVLAVCFLLTGLASVGFPGTLGFVAGEVLMDGAVEMNLVIGLGMILTTALNGIAIVRVYACLFMGPPHVSSVPLGIGLRERLAVLILTLLILGGGLFPQPGITSRYEAAIAILNHRESQARHAIARAQR